MKEDIMKVLKLFKEDKISLEDTMDFLETIYDDTSKNNNDNHTDKKKKFIIIQVESEFNPKENVNIKLPLVLFKMGKKFIPNSTLKNNLNSDDYDIINEKIDSLIKGHDSEFIDIKTNDGKTVKIYTE